MSNTKIKSPNVYDVRVLQRNVGDGTLSRDELDGHMRDLPDVASKSQPFDTTLRGHERDDEDEAGDEQE
ncbi:MAG: hypothetical protein HYV09_15290 [Deltaproteobacteria bacterium]|nr:hypothetical protein [Deltaproteobacteria bacterium]